MSEHWSDCAINASLVYGPRQCDCGGGYEVPSPPVPEITIDPEIMGGEPCIAGTRIPAKTIRSFSMAEYTIGEIQREYPTLSVDQILAAIRYVSSPPVPSVTTEMVDAAMNAYLGFNETVGRIGASEMAMEAAIAAALKVRS